MLVVMVMSSPSRHLESHPGELYPRVGFHRRQHVEGFGNLPIGKADRPNGCGTSRHREL